MKNVVKSFLEKNWEAFVARAEESGFSKLLCEDFLRNFEPENKIWTEHKKAVVLLERAYYALVRLERITRNCFDKETVIKEYQKIAEEIHAQSWKK